MAALLNTDRRYGALIIGLHWLTALSVAGLFALGVWMVDLDYYSGWYTRAPDWHRGCGVLLFAVVALRMGMRIFNRPPRPVPGTRTWEHRAAVIVHWLLLGLTLAVAVAGYLISTADGRSVSVFGWFDIPATITSIEAQEEVFGDIHWYLALALLALSGVHAAAALQHHFLKKDETLRRMAGLRARSPLK